MNVNVKGVFGLLKVMENLTEKGYSCFTPIDDHCAIDLIVVNKSGELLRLQVKYRERIKNKQSIRYEVAAKSTVNGKTVRIDKTLIDGWAVYMSELQEVKYIPVDIFANRKCLIIDPNKDYGKIGWI